MANDPTILFSIAQRMARRENPPQGREILAELSRTVPDFNSWDGPTWRGVAEQFGITEDWQVEEFLEDVAAWIGRPV